MGRRTRAAGAALAMAMIGLAAALAVPVVDAAAVGEAPMVVAVGDEDLAYSSFSIERLGEPSAELKLAVEEAPGLSDGTPPWIRKVEFGLDRSVALEPGDLPLCRWPAVEGGIQIEASGTDECPRAIVGRAEASIEVAYPENKAITIRTVGKIYNGGHRGKATDLLVELPATMPLNVTLTFLVSVRPVRGGRIGSQATFIAPTLAGGDAGFLSLALDLRRGFRQGGERVGYVAAECRDGKLEATTAVNLADGRQGEGETIRACARRRSG